MDTYLAKTRCTNCGYRNHPQWGKFFTGRRIDEHPCNQCGCLTLELEVEKSDPDVGKTDESKSV